MAVIPGPQIGPPGPPQVPPVIANMASMASKQFQNTNTKVSYPSLFSFISLISPFLIVLLLLLNSIINSNIKGLIYLFGVMLLFFIVMLFQASIKITNGNKDTTPEYCHLFNTKTEVYSIPSFNSSLFLFTFIYIMIPMIVYNTLNLPFLCIILILYAIDSGVRCSNSCTTPLGVILGTIIGTIWAIMWYLIISSSDSSLLYYDDLVSNKVACSRPTKQQFKCSVYKNGEFLKSI